MRGRVFKALAANTADVFGLFSFNALGFVVLFVGWAVPLFGAGVELVVRCDLVLDKKNFLSGLPVEGMVT